MHKKMWGMGILGLLAASAALAQEAVPAFAKGAMALALKCDGAAASRQYQWQETELEFRCGSAAGSMQVALRQAGIEAVTDVGLASPVEVLGSPTGKAFVVNSAEAGPGGRSFAVFRLDGTELKRLDVTAPARRAMLDRLAKCWPKMRKEPAFSDPELKAFNMSALAWHDDGRALVVFGQVVPTAAHGAAMGDMLGFEVDSRSGSVMRTLPAADFKQRWQSEAAWDIRVPAPARCGKLFADD